MIARHSLCAVKWFKVKLDLWRHAKMRRLVTIFCARINLNWINRYQSAAATVPEMPGCKMWPLKRPINSFEAADVCCHGCMQTYTLRCNRRHVLSRLQTCILQCVVTNVCRRTLCDAVADMCCHDWRRTFCDVSSRLHADVHFAMQPLTCVVTTADGVRLQSWQPMAATASQSARLHAVVTITHRKMHV